MKIRYFGHSCFEFTTDEGTVLLTDPYKGVGYEMPKNLTADAVFISHGHFDHSNVEGLRTSILLLFADDYTVKEVAISGIECYHDPRQGALRGKNIIFKFTAGGMTFCHMGDVGEPCSDELAEKIGAVDVLFVPVGGTYTVDALGAKEYVDKIAPKAVIPMHYKPADGTLDINTAQLFLSLFEKEEILRVKNGVIEFTKEELQKLPRVIYMERVNNR